MNCRVCGATAVREAGEVEYCSGFAWKVFDCHQCSCRFTKHDESIYDRLHAEAGSTYGTHRDLADQCKLLFDRRDVESLKRKLFEISKYKFIIEEAEHESKSARILEVGCSRGYLTSFFILAGYPVLGSDVSARAIEAAETAFGNFFVLADSPKIACSAPYDMIYHTGTIGCVSNPLSLTRNLLGLLKPEGKLLFNAPNADACWLKEQLWLDSAPPPDLVTLFRPGFWHEHFSKIAEVSEQVEMCPAARSFAIGMRKLCRRRWRKPRPLPLDQSLTGLAEIRPGSNGTGDRLWHLFEWATVKVGRLTHTLRLAPEQPSEFGLLVKITKR